MAYHQGLYYRRLIHFVFVSRYLGRSAYYIRVYLIQIRWQLTCWRLSQSYVIWTSSGSHVIQVHLTVWNFIDSQLQALNIICKNRYERRMNDVWYMYLQEKLKPVDLEERREKSGLAIEGKILLPHCSTKAIVKRCKCRNKEFTYVWGKDLFLTEYDSGRLTSYM